MKYSHSTKEDFQRNLENMLDNRGNTDLQHASSKEVLLDVMMSGMGGLRTCEEIRKVSNVPVLFITAKSQESDKLVGLMAGGDDYLTKPFSYSELLGRVKALLRRYTVYQGKVATEKADKSAKGSQ